MRPFRKVQLDDPTIGSAVTWLEGHSRPSWSVVEGKSPMLRALWRQYESLSVIDGVLHRSFYDSNGDFIHRQLVLPRQFRTPFLELIHNDLAAT